METIRFVAERRYTWIALPYSQFEVMKEHFDMLREYAATHCGYDVPPSQIGWPAMRPEAAPSLFLAVWEMGARAMVIRCRPGGTH